MSRIENSTYTGPYIEIDRERRVRTWPTFAGPEPETLLPDWAQEVPKGPPPWLVHPGPLVDPLMEEVER